jgi:hypothetical protein
MIRLNINRNVLLALILLSLFLLPVTPNLVNAFKSGILGVGPPVHQIITADALSFLKPDVVNTIAENVAVPDSSVLFLNNNYHFDNCNFRETIENINRLYDNVIADFNPASPKSSDAAAKFGLIMHPIQDFYAHSNWVELQNANLVQGMVDNGLAKWTVLQPYSMIRGMAIAVQGGTPPIGFQLIRDDRIVKVTTDLDTFPGLISGTFTELGASSDCPDNIAISHSDLNKDDSSRPLFQKAVNMAIEQTRHEWCRLVNLVRGTYGEDGVTNLYNEWVANTDIATSACL